MNRNNPAKLRELASKMHCIHTVDMHTCGEPVRIVLEGFPELSGSILEKRRQLRSDYDHLRTALMWEPRGHADMYGLIPVMNDTPESDFGVLFMHNAGYSTMCGHATLAIARCAVDLNWVHPQSPITEIRIDTPCGMIVASVPSPPAESQNVSFDNVPSFVLDTGLRTKFDSGKTISFDLAFGGAFYAYVDTKQFDLKIHPKNAELFKSLGTQLKKSIANSHPAPKHPFHKDLSFLYGVIFTEDENQGMHLGKNVCIFADGELDRSPTGSGISGRAALLHRAKKLRLNQKKKVKSIIDSEMIVEIVEEVNFGPYRAVIPRVYGQSFYTGSHQFWVDPQDPLKKGFLLS